MRPDLNNPVIKHHVHCNPNYPEKPEGEPPRHTVVIQSGDFWVLTCADCGAAAIWRPTHRHYKGGLYEVLHEGKLEADLTPVVIYRGQDGQVWVRGKKVFNEIVPGHGKQRFTKLCARRKLTRPAGVRLLTLSSRKS